MTEDDIAGIALKDVVDLGSHVQRKVGNTAEAQHQYWEWLVSSSAYLGYQLLIKREGPDQAAEWLSRAFASFTYLLKEQGISLKVYIARGEQV